MENVFRHFRTRNIINSGDGDDDETRNDQRYGAHHVITLFIPVSLCMFFVVLSSRCITYFTQFNAYEAVLVYTPLQETGSTGNRILMSLANSLIFITFVIIMTIVLIVLYKYRCYKIIQGWLILTTLILLSVILFMYICHLLMTLNLFTIDIISMSVFIWNLGITGMVCLHWRGPLKVKQFYLVIMSGLLALTFYKALPNWTGWFVLLVVSIWDLIWLLLSFDLFIILVTSVFRFSKTIRLLRLDRVTTAGALMTTLCCKSGTSTFNYLDLSTGDEPISTNRCYIRRRTVLSPCGPLRILVKTAQRRNEPIFPSLVYSSAVLYSLLMTNDQSKDQVITEDEEDNQEQDSEESNEREDKGVKLGLGDFIFYSILMCKAAKSDWLTILSTFIAISIGLALTLLLLSLIRTALPALPISIAFGTIAYFSTSYMISPFADYLASEQIFI